ncbi:MAG: hypothetical protein K6E91_09920 [Butyrivibrio sp.]|nr:hypothetical protein [Butyrivibrio sp.]
MVLDRNTKIIIDENDFEGVKTVAGWVREDLEKVFGKARELRESCTKVINLCDKLLASAPEEIRTAFYELIYYPAYGTANLNRTWVESAWNGFYVDLCRICICN